LYDTNRTQISLGVLIEVNEALRQYRDSFVLAGGWAPYFITKGYFDHCGSIDIDLVPQPLQLLLCRLRALDELKPPDISLIPLLPPDGLLDPVDDVPGDGSSRPLRAPLPVLGHLQRRQVDVDRLALMVSVLPLALDRTSHEWGLRSAL